MLRIDGRYWISDWRGRPRWPNGRVGFWQWLVAGWRRSRQRRELLELDERLLRDIGVRPEDARREAEKPFWR